MQSLLSSEKNADYTYNNELAGRSQLNNGIHKPASQLEDAAYQQRQYFAKPDFARSAKLLNAATGAIYAARQQSDGATQRQESAYTEPDRRLMLSDIGDNMQQQQQHDYISKMYLDNTMPLEVSAHTGSTAYLVCRLRSIQQQLHLQVSWVRNMQILTSGELRYTSDERFRPTHLAGSHDWVLEIHNVNALDEGAYECQVNSEPKAASVRLYLHVIAVTLDIVEGPEVQVGEEQQIRLTCRVEFVSEWQRRQSNEPIEGDNIRRKVASSASLIASGLQRPSSQHYIYWYKDNVSLEYNNPRGGVRVELRENASNLEKELTIEGAQTSDSGNYLCKLLPELNEVLPAQTQLTVGGSGSGAFSSFSSNSAGLGFPLARAGSLESQKGFLMSGFSAALVALLVVVLCYDGNSKHNDHQDTLKVVVVCQSSAFTIKRRPARRRASKEREERQVA